MEQSATPSIHCQLSLSCCGIYNVLDASQLVAMFFFVEEGGEVGVSLKMSFGPQLQHLGSVLPGISI